MIRKILTTYAARLDEYLARSHRQLEGVAEVGLIGSAGEQCPNKLVVSLVNLEREASGPQPAMPADVSRCVPCAGFTDCIGYVVLLPVPLSADGACPVLPVLREG